MRATINHYGRSRNPKIDRIKKGYRLIDHPTLIRDESDHQQAVFEWVDDHIGEFPDLENFYAIPNGGLRDISTAIILKAEGVRPGVFDMALDVRRGNWGGMRIEQKTPDGEVSKDQKVWAERYLRQSLLPYVSHCWTETVETLISYLKGEQLAPYIPSWRSQIDRARAHELARPGSRMRK